ncbi:MULTISPECIES: hypothetical protein [unclassified Endozoicomonas]|uniref:hypothetical protein n=1 Tax=unclassified Endozoicomonas TaxID=2644528 RepID=UPI003BB72FBE
MNKLPDYLTRLIAPLFLLQALILQAHVPIVSSYISCLQISPCNTLMGQTSGVEQRLKQYRELVNGKQCVVLSVDPSEDLGRLVKKIPENTVILLSSATAPGATLSPSPFPVTDKTPAVYFVDTEIVLKNGQDIIGAADDGFEIVIRDRSYFEYKHILRVGYPESFKPEETKDSHIRHLAFSPWQKSFHHPIDSIVFAECFNRKLIVEDNLFMSPARAAFALDCKKSFDASDSTRNPGPNLLFVNNKISGGKYSWIPDYTFYYVTQEQGIFINLPSIINQSDRLSVIGNTFEYYIAQAAEFRLAPGSKINVFNNIVNIFNAGLTIRSSARKGGFVLVGPAHSPSKLPVFFLAGNQIKVTQTAINVRGHIRLTLACNQLQAFNPWWQPLKQSSIRAMPAPLEKVSGVCGSLVGPTTVMSTPTANSTVAMSTPAVNSTVAIPTPTTHGSIRFANTWTPINNSSSTACAGLVNSKSQFFFYSEICQPFTLRYASASASASSVSVADTTSSSLLAPTKAAGTTAKITGLGVLASLAIWLNL